MSYRKKSFSIADQDGREIEGIPFLMPAKSKTQDSFMMLFLEQLNQISKDRELAGRHLRILLHLLSISNYENYITETVAEQAKGMGMDTRNYSRSLKLLLEKGLVIKCAKWRNAHVYKINSHLAWRGKIHNLEKERRKSIKEIQAESVGPVFRQATTK